MGMSIRWIQDIDLRVDEVGGKAAGLSKLIEWGLAIPAGFVIVDAKKKR
jgi:pyruvate,water dikinase